MNAAAKANRIAYLQREIAHYTNPPAHVDAGWAARCLANATEALAKLTWAPSPATAADLEDNARMAAGFRNYR